MATDPTPEEVDAAILMMNPRQMQAMEEFFPGMHPKHIQAVHHELIKQGLINVTLRPATSTTVKLGDYVFTDLGRAVQARLKDKNRK